MNWSLAYGIAKFVIWLILNIKEFVRDAEDRNPVPGKGAEKFAAVREAVEVAARFAGLADTAIEAVKGAGIIDQKIDEAVATEINSKK